MTNSWHLTLFQDEDLDGLVDLCQLQPGKAEVVTAEYIRWQRNANPAGQAQVGVAKETATGRILGVVWFVPLRVQIGSQVVLGSQSLYALVHPDYRGRGIFTGLVPIGYESARRQGVQFSYGFPNQNSYPPFINRLGWTRIGEARLLLRPLNVKRLVTRRLGRGILQGAIATAGQAVGKLIFRPRSFEKEVKHLSITEVRTNDPSLDDFWQRVRGKYPVMLVRDTAFLDWRYTKIPERTYRMLAASLRGSIMATIVLRDVTIEGIPCGMIVDFLVLPTPEGRQAGEALLRKATSIFEELGLDLVGCLMLPRVEEVKLLVRQGFVLCPAWLQPQPFPVILLGEADTPKWDRLREINSWFLTMGDFDAV